MMQGHVVMHGAMLTGSLLVPGNLAVLRFGHAATFILILLSLCIKDTSFKMTASLVNLSASILYVSMMLYVNFADFKMDMQDTLTDMWVDLEILVFCGQIYSMVIFMLVAYLTSMKSIWHNCFPNQISPCGTYIIKNVWNNKSSCDFLHFMKFECL